MAVGATYGFVKKNEYPIAGPVIHALGDGVSGGIYGAALGAALGAMIPGKVWDRIPPASLRGVASGDGSYGVALSLRY